MDTTPQPSRPRVALVIGSGGIKCVASLGLWRALQREGVAVDMAVGCSGGSVYAAVMALGWDVQVAEAQSYRLWAGTFNRLHYPSLLRALLPQVFGFGENFGLVDDRRINAVMRESYGDATFADTRIPLYIAATELKTGEQVLLSEGRIGDAVRASIAIPVMLRPWQVGGRWLMDGGASDPLPVSVAIREGADTILAMGFENPYSSRINSLSTLVGQTSGLIVNNLLKSRFSFYNLAHHAEVIPILPEFDRPIQLTSTHLIPYLIEQGEKAAEAQMPYLLRLLKTAA